MQCPNCAADMTAMQLDGQVGTTVTIDVCKPCQAFWFDKHESPKLSPRATLQLFELIGEQAKKPRTPISNEMRCPRCSRKLLDTHDKQRNTPFRYWRCAADQGRFTSFYDFLREKDFVKPMSPQQIAELRTNVKSINCAGCGAPIDLAKSTECSYCRSPLTMLDMQRAGELIDQLKRASVQTRAIDPLLALELERAKHYPPDPFARFDVGGDEWWSDVETSGMIGAAISAVRRAINKNTR